MVFEVRPAWLATWIGAALAACAGCAARGRDDAPRRQSTAIVSGEPSPSPDDDAVVLIRHVTADGEILCTGTLVAANLVVTARHCVSFVNDGLFQCTVRGEPIALTDGGGVLGADIAPESIEVYTGAVPGSVPVARGQEIISTLSLTECVNDLAFVVLDRSLGDPVASVRLGTKTVAGEAVHIVGYGIEQKGPSELDWQNRPRKKSHQLIAAVGPDATENVTTVRPRTIVTNGPSACKGDSGGPALSDKTGAVIGVYSIHGGSDDCSSPAVVHYYTHLPPFRSLALQAFVRAQAEPVIEKRTPFGQPCLEASDCEEAVCVTGDDAVAHCSRVCDAAAPCPDGYECRPPAAVNGPNVCTALVPSDAALCPACDASAPAPPPPASNDGGCAMSRKPGRPTSAAAAALVAAWTVLTRRRRSPRRRSPGNWPPRRTRTA
jgi:hypothetical protein